MLKCFSINIFPSLCGKSSGENTEIYCIVRDYVILREKGDAKIKWEVLRVAPFPAGEFTDLGTEPY